MIELSNDAIKGFVESHPELIGGIINNIQENDEKNLKIKIKTKLGEKTLMVGPGFVAYTLRPMQAKMNPGGYSALLKKYLKGKRILDFKQVNLERIIEIKTEKNVLMIELFAKGNIILCDEKGKIIRAMRKEEWKDRKLEAEEEYKLPTNTKENPTQINEKTFERKTLESKKSFFGAIVDIVNAPPTIIEKCFENLNLDKKKNAIEATPTEIELLSRSIKKIFSENDGKARVIGKTIYSAQIPCEKEYPSIDEAVNEMLNEEKPIQEKNEKTDKKVKDWGKIKLYAIEGLEKSEIENKQKAEKIFENYQLIKDIINATKKAKEKKISEKEAMEKINQILTEKKETINEKISAKKQVVKKIDYKTGKIIIEI
jgi:predicted ribosome quality control (RQC) complex YloA/Tae2 family protein